MVLAIDLPLRFRRRCSLAGALEAGGGVLVSSGFWLLPVPVALGESRQADEVIFGMGFAFAVLSGMGYLIYQTIQWVEAASRAEEERSDDR